MLQLYKVAIWFIISIPLWCSAQPIIVDTDLDVDDVIALLYVLKNPEVSVKAITIETLGNHYCQAAVHNALGVLRLTNQDSVTLACGPESQQPLVHAVDKQAIARILSLSGTAHLLPTVRKSYQQDAVTAMIATIKKSSVPITLLAIGQLTHIAAALHQDPTIKKNIQAIVIMGGAIRVPGNVSEKRASSESAVAEWNFYLDAKATQAVFQSRIPIHLIPLDVTNTLPLDRNFFHKLQHYQQSIAARYLNRLLRDNPQLLAKNFWYLWDPAAAVLLTHPELGTWHSDNVRITSSGATVIDDRQGTSISVCLRVDKDKLTSLLLKTINSTP